MLPSRHKRLRSNPMHINQILAPQRLSHIPERFGRRLFFFLLLALERIETHRLVCTESVNVGSGIQETCVRDSGLVVDNLVQSVFFFCLRDVEDVY
jgi:hypothetical protein